MSSWIYRFFVLIALGMGFGIGSGRIHWKESPTTKVVSNIHPEREYPLRELKKFAIVLHCHNDAPWIEQTLTSIFSQEYEEFRVLCVDDGSIDGTQEVIERFAQEMQQQERIICLRTPESSGPVASLYTALHYCLDQEIVFPCRGRDWLATPTALARVNRAFQNPDVWMVTAAALLYPEYSIQPAPSENFAFAESFLRAPLFCYAGLLRQIPLACLLDQTRFARNPSHYRPSLVALAGGRWKSLSDPVVFENRVFAPSTASLLPVPSLAPLAKFPSSPRPECADVVLFSRNRPLQLYALLESIDRCMTGVGQIAVLYRADDERFRRAYDEVRATFAHVRFVAQGEKPRRDFKPLLIDILGASPSPFVLFGVDDIVVKDHVDLRQCTDFLQRTQAYAFYLRFGRHIDYCYMAKSPQRVPDPIPVAPELYAWPLQTGEFDWGFSNNVDMTLYRKAPIISLFKEMSYQNPTSLEVAWSAKKPPSPIGLYFARSKIVNIPMNVLDNTGTPHMNFLSAEELLVKFNEGLKIDIDPLYQIDNNSPHFEFVPEFVSRY